MRFSRSFSPILFIFFLLSCHEKEENPNAGIKKEDFSAWYDKKVELYSRKIRYTIDSLRLRPICSYADKYSRKYYSSAAPFLWITRSGIDERADTLLSYLEKTGGDGLPEGIFYVNEIRNELYRIRRLDFDKEHDIHESFGRAEFLLTQAYFRYACGQRFGYLQPGSVLNSLEQTDTAQNAPFRKLYDIKIEKADDAFIQKAIDSQRNGKLTEFFQEIQPSGNTYSRLSEAYRNARDTDRKRKIAVNLERSRWRSLQPRGKYVWVNLADMMLRAVNEAQDDTLEMKICIGSPKNKSPMLISQIERVDMNPYWNIPYSIIKKEIAPRHAGDADYFTRNRYRIFDKSTGEEVDPVNVTAAMLTSGNYRVRQDNGQNNSLGRLIFRFPNDFSIYLHDTNNKQAFDRTNRAMSHGCIRVEKPLELAVFLVDDPTREIINRLRKAVGLPPQDTPEAVAQTSEEPIRMETLRIDPPIPVFIPYFTFYPLANGKWEDAPDTYGYDEALLKKLDQL
ncbi:MAG: L,D-transpeptidase family protein [Paraprevotella sp.]|nr:L,D-transpeptidase family protein [Paraprevotella sp.]